MNRLIDTIDPALSIGNTTQTSTGQKPERTRDDTGLVTNDIAKQVAGDNNAVQLPRVLHHHHGRGVNKLVPNLHLREFLRHNFRHRLAPQPTRREDVGLVQAPHGQRRVVLQGEVCREAGDTLNLDARVRLRVQRVAATVVLLALAEVDTAGKFSDDVEVDATAHFGAEWGSVDQRGGCEVAGPQVTEGGHFFAQFEETLFGADGTRAPFLFIPLLSASVMCMFVLRHWRTGPPMAPKRTASAFFAAFKASSVRGLPVASIDA